MKRKIFLNQNILNQQIIKINDQEIISRITKVYRLDIGRRLIFVGKDLGEGYYLLKNKNKNELIFQLQQKIKRYLLPKREIIFYLSFIKKENFELILSKSFELGVKTIIPIKTERSSWFTDKIFNRWLKILYKGLEIADWNYLPEIKTPITLEEIPEKIYVLDKKGKLINNINFENKVSLLIGPEGGFSEKENKIFKTKKCRLVSLGDINLKTETAFFISLALFNFS